MICHMLRLYPKGAANGYFRNDIAPAGSVSLENWAAYAPREHV